MSLFGGFCLTVPLCFPEIVCTIICLTESESETLSLCVCLR